MINLLLSSTRAETANLKVETYFTDATSYMRHDYNSLKVEVSYRSPVTETVVVAQNSGGISVSGGTMNFTPENYDQVQTATISLLSAATIPGFAYFTVTDSSGASSYRVRTTTENISHLLHNRAANSYFKSPHIDNVLGWLWGTGFDSVGSLPTAQPDSIERDYPGNAYINPTGWANLKQIDRATYSFGNGWTTYLYHFVPTTPNNKLMCVWFGHGDDWDMNNFPAAMQYFSDLGYSVITCHMLGYADNVNGDGVARGIHLDEDYSVLESSSPYFNPVSYFIEPSIVALNWVTSEISFDNIYSTGLSGGGWMQTWLSAIDKRIEKGFSMAGAGSIWAREVYMRPEITDYEQGAATSFLADPTCRTSAFVVDFYENKCTYQDLFKLAAENAEFYLYHNNYDPVVFYGHYNFLWNDDVKEKVGASGKFECRNYTDGAHQYTPAVLDEINGLLSDSSGVTQITETSRATPSKSTTSIYPGISDTLYPIEDFTLEAGIQFINDIYYTTYSATRKAHTAYFAPTSTDYFVQMVITSQYDSRFFSLGLTSDENLSYLAWEYGMGITNKIRTQEHGNNTFFDSYGVKAGDVLRMEVSGSNILFRLFRKGAWATLRTEPYLNESNLKIIITGTYNNIFVSGVAKSWQT